VMFIKITRVLQRSFYLLLLVLFNKDH